MASDDVIRDLTLMLAYLTSWKERGLSFRRSWKGYDFDILNRLEEEGMIDSSPRAKSLYLTVEGEDQARQLLAKYRITDTDL